MASKSSWWLSDLWSGGHWGNDLSYDEQLSPNRALRTATLKSRFADTILKARQGALLSQVLIVLT